MIPFFIFYSMFGFQRVGDLIWAAGDSRCRGFLIGGTAGTDDTGGRGTAASGWSESPAGLSGTQPAGIRPGVRLRARDPSFRDGIRRMYVEQESVFYYLTVENQPYPMPTMPEGCREGILRGLYRFQPSPSPHLPHRAQVLGSGAILLEVIKAQGLLEQYDVAADVWSVTSWAQLYRDGHDCDRWNMLHPLDTPREPYVTQCLATAPGVVVAASDYLKALPDSLSQWLDRPLVALGTDGFGRSESRADLRNFFEVDARFITLATLRALSRDGAIVPQIVAQAITDLEIDPDKVAPMTA